MRFIITNHARKRRPNHIPRSRDELLHIIHLLNVMFDFQALEDGKYKIFKAKHVAIIVKKSNKLTLITIRGFKEIEDLVSEGHQLPFRKVSEEEENAKRQRRLEKKGMGL